MLLLEDAYALNNQNNIMKFVNYVTSVIGLALHKKDVEDQRKQLMNKDRYQSINNK